MMTFQWLEQVRTRHNGKPLTLKLRHVRTDGTTQPVDDFELEGEPQTLAGQIEERAQSEADVLGGTQTYAVVAMNGNDSVSRHIFRVDGSAGHNEIGLSEPATAQGIIGQIMRHNEAITRMLVTSYATTTAAKDKELSRLTARCQVLEQRDDDRARTAEKIRSKQHERELQAADANHRRQMVQEIVHDGRMLVPFIVNETFGKKEGKKLLPDAPLSPNDLSFKAFFESLRPDQIEGLKGVLNDFQYMAVLEAYKQFVGKGDKGKSEGSANDGKQSEKGD